MKTEKIVWGLILVFIGGILMLENFDVIDFRWSAIWHLWPVVLIVIGANMIINRTPTNWGAAASIVLTLVVLGFVGYEGVNGRSRFPRWLHYDYKNDEDGGRDYTTDSEQWKTNAFSEPYVSTVKKAKLEISGGATDYDIRDTSSNLIDIDVKHRNSGYSLNKVTTDSVEVLKFHMRSGKNRFRFSDFDETKARLKLSTKPLWDISIKMGAGESDFDLTRFKVEKVALKGGAASFNLKVGMPETSTTITSSTGMAEVKLLVPKEAACQIKVSSGISSRDFDGFEKQSDGMYRTSNFNSGAKKITINLKGGLSDFEVSRY